MQAARKHPTKHNDPTKRYKNSENFMTTSDETNCSNFLLTSTVLILKKRDLSTMWTAVPLYFAPDVYVTQYTIMLTSTPAIKMLREIANNLYFNAK